jgi:hypothetical protein
MDAELEAAIKRLNDLFRYNTRITAEDRSAWNLVRSALYHHNAAAADLLATSGDWTINPKAMAELRRAVEGTP